MTDRQPRQPTRLPIRGTIAAAGTVGAMALLLSVRGGPLAPSDSVQAASDSTLATDELIAAATATSGADAVVEPQTITGDLVATRWGAVQVQVTLEGSDITDVVALTLPAGDRHSADISDYVESILREEAIATDSADISVISGATYTSEAYAESLQAALDQAGVSDTGEQDEMTAATVESEDIATEEATESDEAPAAESTSDEVPAAQSTSDEAVTVTGDAVSIRWGTVQVAVTAVGDDVIDVETLSIPLGDSHSDRINADAEPILREEAIAADSSDISVVSGATYTSRAYAQSLQSALDQLGI